MGDEVEKSGSDDVVINYHSLMNRINKARNAGALVAPHVDLCCVTKTQDFARIEPLLKAGARIFGENRLQEAQMHWEGVRDVYPDLDLRLIGPLQSNKASMAVALFDVIETIDRVKIAESIASEMAKQGRSPRLYIQVNIGEEPQKAGILPHELDAFMQTVRHSIGLNITGLMCIPPLDGPRGPYFALMRQMAKTHGITHLSMGMSDDFECAIGFGASEVRLGSVLFGARPQA